MRWPNSTDLAQSYNPSGKKYQKLQKELQEWAAAGFPILRVLVTAGVQGKANDVQVKPHAESRDVDAAEPEDETPENETPEDEAPEKEAPENDDDKIDTDVKSKDDSQSQDAEKKIELSSERPAVERGTPCLEYFIRCDSKQTELLFGSGFKTLLEGIRAEDQSLLAIYKKLNRPTTKTTTKTRETGKMTQVDLFVDEGEDEGEDEDNSAGGGGGVLGLLR